MKRTAKLEIHKKELDAFGVQMKPIAIMHERVKVAHRDDHYMFILQQQGEFLWEIDFKEVKMKGASICFVTPGQVHREVMQKNNKGWFVFVDTGMIAEQYRNIFDTFQRALQVVSVRQDDHIFNCLPILEQLVEMENNQLKRPLISSMVASVAGMIAAKMIQAKTPEGFLNGQRYQLSTRFKQSVRNNYKDLKQVQQYAERLNITPLYLNEVMKEITGFPASYWIQQEILLEAKRLLYYTVMDVKQIAYELGYEDHTYFSRFFKKNTGSTPQQFRIKNHELSNHSL